MEQQFGARLRQLRKIHKETQPELAKALGVSRSAISMYESGEREPKFELLLAIAKRYDVELDYLLGRDRLTEELPADEPTEAEMLHDPDIRMIARAGQKMTQAQKENLLKYAKFMFPEAFEDRDA